MAKPTFDPVVLDVLRSAKEVSIRTDRRPDRGVIIWIVVADDAVFVRSFRGPKGAWYVAAKADGQATLEFGGRLVPVRITPVADPATIVAVSQEFLRKYSGSPYAPTMVAPDLLPTTLQLWPM